jgi:hypothetical protein
MGVHIPRCYEVARSHKKTEGVARAWLRVALEADGVLSFGFFGGFYDNFDN